MKRYKNLSGNSGVCYYRSGADFIEIEFVDGARYLYTYASAGRMAIEKMKVLAPAGKGLSTFVAQHIGKAYAAKLR